jgi:hypothetical protein
MQDDFFGRILEIYEREQFAVLGPRIILNNEMDHPVMEKFPPQSKLSRELERYQHICKRYSGRKGVLLWYCDTASERVKRFLLESKCTLRYLLGKLHLLPEITYWK